MFGSGFREPLDNHPRKLINGRFLFHDTILAYDRTFSLNALLFVLRSTMSIDRKVRIFSLSSKTFAIQSQGIFWSPRIAISISDVSIADPFAHDPKSNI